MTKKFYSAIIRGMAMPYPYRSGLTLVDCALLTAERLKFKLFREQASWVI
jgi:hypothetical protein